MIRTKNPEQSTAFKCLLVDYTMVSSRICLFHPTYHDFSYFLVKIDQSKHALPVLPESCRCGSEAEQFSQHRRMITRHGAILSHIVESLEYRGTLILFLPSSSCLLQKCLFEDSILTREEGKIEKLDKITLHYEESFLLRPAGFFHSVSE